MRRIDQRELRQRAALLTATILSLWQFGAQLLVIAGRGHSLFTFDDFLVFWTSGPAFRLGGLAELVDTARFTARQNALFAWLLDRPAHTRPWLYPPTFLLISQGFSLLPYWVSVAVTQLFGAVAMGLTLRGRLLRLGLVLLSPAFGALLIPGQLSAWIASGIVGGLLLVEAHPVAAGIVLGLASVKPHLFLLVPVALVAARAWRTLVACLATAVALGLLSLMAFGWTAWGQWLHSSTGAGRVLTTYFDLYTNSMGSVFASLRGTGVDVRIAWAMQGVSAVLATLGVWWVFSRTTAIAPRLLILSSGSLLVAPYWLSYDLILPTLALAVVACGEGTGWRHGVERTTWWLVWMLPYTMLVSWGLLGIPIGAATIALLFLVTLLRTDSTRGVTAERP